MGKKNKKENAVVLQYLGCGAAALASIFVGFMITSAGSYFFPAVNQIHSQFYCNGEVIVYRKVQGLNPPIVCRNAISGATEGITFLYLGSGTLLYGLIFFILIYLIWILTKRVKK